MGRIEVALLLDPRRVFLARDHWVGEFGLAGLPLQFPPLSLLLFFSNFLGESLHLFAIDSVEKRDESLFARVGHSEGRDFIPIVRFLQSVKYLLAIVLWHQIYATWQRLVGFPTLELMLSRENFHWTLYKSLVIIFALTSWVLF